MTIADRIKMRREEVGLTQADLAKKMNLRSRSSITRIEKSGDNVTLKDLARISSALNCSVMDLMGWEDEVDEVNQVAYTYIPDLGGMVAEEHTYNAKKKDDRSLKLPDDADENAMKLLETYDELSEEGKKSLIDYADFLYRKEMYK